MNLGYAIKEITELLKSHDVTEPAREASLLVCLSIRKDKTFLIAHPEYELTADEQSLLKDFVRRRANREPYQYIAGKQEFYGLEFEVTSDVLIPRAETEILVERAIESLQKRRVPSTFLEVGIGSGCIAVSMLSNEEKARAVGVDISIQALAVAKRNATRHGVADRLGLFVSDAYSELDRRDFDLIVSNPPYVPVADIGSLQSEVRDFEPFTSLTDGGSGLSIIEKIIRGAPDLLRPQGELLIEIGFDQSSRVEKMFDPNRWQKVDFLADLQGIPRSAYAVLHLDTKKDGGTRQN